MSSSKTPAASTLTEIDPSALDAVVGGLRTATSSTSSDTRVLDAITSLGSSIKSLGTQNQAQPAGGGIAALMPMLLAGGLGQSGGAAAASACPAGCCAGMNATNVIRR